MSAKNPKLDYQLIGYATPYRFKITIAWAASQHYSRSNALNEMIDFFIQKNFNEQQKKKFIDFFDKMSEDQKRHPSRFWDLQDKKENPGKERKLVAEIENKKAA